MSEAKITPGPWSWEFSRIGGKRIALSNHSGQDVMTATSEGYGGYTFIDISEENARLIDATPDLLEDCEALLALIQHETNLPESARNGVTDSTETIDEGEVRAAQIIEKARLDVRRAKGEAV